SRTRLRGRVRTAVMRRQDLEILDGRASIAVVVLDAHIRKLHVVLDHRELVRRRPCRDLIGVPIGPAIRIATAAVGRLQEPLTVTLQLVIEHDATDATTVAHYAFRRAAVGAIQVRVMRQFTRLADACVEPLRPVALAILAAVFQDVTTSVRQRDKRRPRLADDMWHGPNQPEVTEMPELRRRRCLLLAEVG